MPTNKRVLGSVVALTLLGFALRFFHLNIVSLRGDEAFTVLHWMREPLAQTLANIATVDPQAPLSYVLFRGWALVMGTSEYVARILPALLSVVAVPILYALGHRLGGRRLGLMAAFFWAINPNQIWHAQDARNYAIWAVLSVCAVWLALRALDRQRRVDWILYIVVGTLAAYVYYLELFIILVLSLYVFPIYWRNRRLILRWIGAEIAIGFLLAPWYLQSRLLLGSGYGGTGSHFEAQQWITRFLPTLTFGTPKQTFGTVFPTNIGLVLVLVLLAGLVIGLVLLWKQQHQHQALLLMLWGMVPLVLLGIVSTRLNVFEPRYVLAAAPAYTLILCALVLYFRSRLVVTVGFVVVLLMGLFVLLNYYSLSDYAKSPNWRGLALYLHQHTQPDDWVIQAAADESFTFYCQDYQAAANCDDKLPANPNQSPQEIDRLLTMRNQEHMAIWYVANLRDWANGTSAEDWLKANMQLVRSTSVDTLPVQEFKRWQVSSSEIAVRPFATFGDSIELVGSYVASEPTDTLTLWLYWRALQTTATSQKVFVHLGNANQIFAQADHYPQEGRVSTDSWQIGSIYRDVYSLSLDGIPSGEYALSLGFYDPETNRRLPIGDGDSYTLQTLHVH